MAGMGFLFIIDEAGQAPPERDAAARKITACHARWLLLFQTAGTMEKLERGYPRHSV
jgi:hypothetical protein